MKLSPNQAGILGAIILTAVFALTIGLTYPLLSFILESQGYSESAIGLNAAATPLGVLIASPLYPRLVRRFGTWQVAIACLLVVSAVLLLMGLTGGFVAIMLLRFTLGLADVGVYIISETWINQLADKKTRGRVIGLYATAFTAGFGAGPLILSVTGIEGLTPFAIGAVLCLLPVAIVLMIRKVVPGIEDEEAVSSFGFVWLAPTLLLAIVIFAFWDAALLALFPVFGLGEGLDPRFITLAMSVAIFGNTFLQIPIGWVSDKTSRRAVMIACAFATGLGSIAMLSVVQSHMAFLILLFFWGATAGGIYTMGMAELGDRFDGAELEAGNAAFAIAFGVGGIIGGPITGAAMDVAGSNGYVGTLAGAFIALGAIAWWRRRAVT